MLADSSLTTCSRAAAGAWFNYPFLTSKERDNETGLDFFGARYYGSTQGRFTSADPLLSSGSIDDPQTWNRYSYTLNNPLKYTDPFGLYEWEASLGGSATDDELKKRKGGQKIIDRRNEFRQGLTAAAKAAGSNKLTADQRAEITRGVNAYGTEGDANGVNIATGKVKDGSAAVTSANGDYGFTADSNGNVTPSITVTFNQNSSIDAEGVAHEGSHVADRVELVSALTSAMGTEDWVKVPQNVTRYATELRAYRVGSSVAQGLGVDSYNANNTEYWNSGWKAADRETKRQAGIDKILRNQYKVTPDNQGPRLIELKKP